MILLKKIANFYINASIHVALAVYSFVRLTEVYFDIAYNEALNYFIFYGSITGYNFVKYFGIAKFHHRSLTKNLKYIQVFSLLCFLMLCFYAFQLPYRVLLFISPFGLITLLYAIPFLSGFQKNLRSISYLKIVIVGSVWSGVTVMLPLYSSNMHVDETVLILMLQRFLLVVVLILPFDIRDMKFDAISLQTIPQKIGIERTKKLGYVLLLLAGLLEFILHNNFGFKNVFLVFFFVTLIFLMRASSSRSKYYTSFWVESIPIFWFLVIQTI